MSTDGSIKIKIDGAQAAATTKDIKQGLVDLDAAAKKSQGSVENLSGTLKEASQTINRTRGETDKMSSSLNSIRTYAGKSLTELKNLNASINQLIASQQQLNALLSQSRAGFNQQATGANAATESMRRSSAQVKALNTDLGVATSSARLLSTTMLAFGQGLTLAYAIHTLVEFDHAMAQTQSITKSVGAELDMLRQKAKELGAETIYTSGEAAQGMKFLAQAGFSVNEIMTASGQVLALAQAGNLGLAEAAEISAKALRGFRLEAWQMGDVADVMAAATAQSVMNIQELGFAFKYVAPVAASLGVDIRQTSAAIGVLSDAGIDATMAGTALRRIMSELQGPTRTTMRVLKAHGLTLADVDISTRGLIPVMETLASKGLDIGESFAIFGQRGGPAFETISQQVDKLKEKTASLENVTGEVLKRQEIMAGSLFAAFKEFTSKLEYFWIQLSEGSGALDALKATLFEVSQAIEFLTNNMYLLTPLFLALGGVALKSLISGMGTLIAHFATLGPVAVPSLTKAGVAQAYLTAQMSAGVVAARGAAAATAMWTRALAAVGGVPGLAIMGLVTAVAAYAMHQDAGTRAAEQFNDVLKAQKKGAEETAKAMKNMSDQIKGMQIDAVRVAIAENDKLMNGWDGLKRQIQSVNVGLWEFSDSFSDFFSDDTRIKFSHAHNELEKVKQQFLSGKINASEFKAELRALSAQYNNPALSKVVLELIDLADKQDIAEQRAALLEYQWRKLNGTLDEAPEKIREVGRAMDALQLIQGDLGAKVLQAAVDTQYELMFAKMEKGAEKAHKSLYKLVGSEVYANLVLTQSEGKWTVAAKAVDEYGRKIEPLSPTLQQAAEDILNNEEAIDKLRKEHREAGKGTQTLTNATGALAKEVARLTMTQEAFQRWEFLDKLDELEKKLGGVNPQIQMLRNLMAQAQAVGLDSPKQIIEVETQFEKFKKFGSMKEFDIQSQQLDVQLNYLRDRYAENEDELARITEFGESARAELRRKYKDKDIQSQLAFWKDYVSISGRGEQEYYSALEISLQNQRQAYLDAGVDAVAVEEWVANQRIQHSRRAEDGIIRGLQKLSEEYGNQAAMMEQVVTTVFTQMTDALAEWAMTGEMKFDQFVKSVGTMLWKLAVQAMIVKPMLSFLGFAQGGVFQGGRVTAFASGGVVSSPTLFPMKDGVGMMGEAGPEAIMPLVKMPSGRLGVEATGAGGVGNITLYNYNYFEFAGGGSGSQGAGNQDDQALAQTISDTIQHGMEQFVIDTLMRQMRPGGVLNRPG